MKPCSRCKTEERTAYSGWCKPCLRKGRKEYAKRRPEAYEYRKKMIRDYNHNPAYLPRKFETQLRKAPFKLTPEDWARMFNAQDGKCAIGGEKLDGAKGTHVDHDHVTNAVRGLLCSNCNTALGLLNDDVTKMERAMKYLKGELT